MVIVIGADVAPANAPSWAFCATTVQVVPCGPETVCQLTVQEPDWTTSEVLPKPSPPLTANVMLWELLELLSWLNVSGVCG